ncbi:MAG TPA: flagellar biosynthesis protein FlgB, partial [Sulfitobacter sp.]|nr:flagellar biosynthesis protein FlgB [Sulfitobacter sp.]
MNLSNLSILGLASDRMQWLSARQKVVSENVANASTPNF